MIIENPSKGCRGETKNVRGSGCRKIKHRSPNAECTIQCLSDHVLLREGPGPGDGNE